MANTPLILRTLAFALAAALLLGAVVLAATARSRAPRQVGAGRRRISLPAPPLLPRTVLADSLAPHRSVDISPDGTSILFVALGEKIARMPVGGATVEVLAAPASDRVVVESPVWRPDSRAFAYVRFQREGTAGQVVIQTLGGGETVFDLPAGDGASVSWSPDGTELAVSGAEAGVSRIGTIEVATGRFRPAAAR